MALSNLAAQQSESILLWSKATYRELWNQSFIMQMAGTNGRSPIERISEFTATNNGSEAIMNMLNKLTGDGIMGDHILEGNEEAMRMSDCKINVDQIRHAVRKEGRMADKKAWFKFYDSAKYLLAGWQADKCDEMALLTLAGESWTKTSKGGVRPSNALANGEGKKLSEHASAANVTAPTPNRELCINGGQLISVANGGSKAAITASDKLSLKTFGRVRAHMENHYIAPVAGSGGTALYHAVLTPDGIAQLKEDPDFVQAVLNATQRSNDNQIFKGYASIYIDGFMIHMHRHAFTNVNAGAGNYYGASGTVKGQKMVVLGSQALAMADIGLPMWDEDTFDYNNQKGVACNKGIGFKKPVFRSSATDTSEDFGVCVVNAAL